MVLKFGDTDFEETAVTWTFPDGDDPKVFFFGADSFQIVFETTFDAGVDPAPTYVVNLPSSLDNADHLAIATYSVVETGGQQAFAI